MTKSDATITFMTDEDSKPAVRIADGIVWLSFGTGSTRVAVAVTPEQALALMSEMRTTLYVKQVTAVRGLEEAGAM